ncbi:MULTISPECIES: bacillithiol biosynthesis cysteine-adding enzyme BshC [Bacillus]|uniref:bacillithiol biosynthesis cysteine-adding enzyme BshC n=1 Tax=Bacillus TaxID=1386 RepID=UPI000BB67FA7|nr:MULTISPECIES: bacillithiol biosynthesis cysteine-adding enzyme BshC [Bacillus]
MDVLDLSLPPIYPFASDYMKEKKELLDFFSYNPFSPNVYRERFEELLNRQYNNRMELSTYLHKWNSKYNASLETLRNVERLNDEQSVVVIGGQQAGLLTGPFYTISKIISIIQLAKEQEESLQVPVIPVFWIAGEDHDFQEINHLFVSDHHKIRKASFKDKTAGKKMISELSINKDELNNWVREIFAYYQETEHTNDLLKMVERAVEQSNTYVDFFAYLITALFANEGLVLLNAADPELRELEKKHFHLLLENHQNITNEVLHVQEKLFALSYKPMLEVQGDSTNLFFHDNGERNLLYWNDEDRNFFTADGKIFEEQELKGLLEQSSALFSNNVVTRPLMQDLLFPTLAFIAGPGEVAYWGELKGAFSSLALTMPPVVPRLHFTILERSVHSTLNELEVSLQEALEHGVKEKQKAILNELELKEMENQLQEFYSKYKLLHKELGEFGSNFTPNLQSSFHKNWAYIDKQFNYMTRLMEKSAYEKHENLMKKYERVQNALRPNGTPQERTWNVFYFLNIYGLDFLNAICSLTLKHDGMHKVLKP